MASQTPETSSAGSSGLDLSFVASIVDWLEANIMHIIGAFAVLVIGLLIAGVLSRWAERALGKSSKFEPTVANFLSNIVKYALWAVLTSYHLATRSLMTKTMSL